MINYHLGPTKHNQFDVWDVLPVTAEGLKNSLWKVKLKQTRVTVWRTGQQIVILSIVSTWIILIMFTGDIQLLWGKLHTTCQIHVVSQNLHGCHLPGNWLHIIFFATKVLFIFLPSKFLFKGGACSLVFLTVPYLGMGNHGSVIDIHFVAQLWANQVGRWVAQSCQASVAAVFCELWV